MRATALMLICSTLVTSVKIEQQFVNSRQTIDLSGEPEVAVSV